MDEMIEAVKAALAPGADEETKRRGAAILRRVLSMLEPAEAVPGASPPPPAAIPATNHGGPPDLLTFIVDRLRPLLPPDTIATLPGVRFPMIDFGSGPAEK